MLHLERFFSDLVLDLIDCINRLNVFKKTSCPSLIAHNIIWFTNSEWMDRLIAYKQLELWTIKH